MSQRHRTAEVPLPPKQELRPRDDLPILAQRHAIHAPAKGSFQVAPRGLLQDVCAWMRRDEGIPRRRVDGGFHVSP